MSAMGWRDLIEGYSDDSSERQSAVGEQENPVVDDEVAPAPTPVLGPVLIDDPPLAPALELAPALDLAHAFQPVQVGSPRLPARGWSEPLSVYADPLVDNVLSGPFANHTVNPRQLAVPGHLVPLFTGNLHAHVIPLSAALVALIDAGVELDPFSVGSPVPPQHMPLAALIPVPDVALPAPPAPPAPPALPGSSADDAIDIPDDEDLNDDNRSEASGLTDLSGMSGFAELEAAAVAPVVEEPVEAVVQDYIVIPDNAPADSDDESDDDSDFEEGPVADCIVVRLLNEVPAVPVIRGHPRGRPRGSSRGGRRGGSRGFSRLDFRSSTPVAAAPRGRGSGGPSRGYRGRLSLRHGRQIPHGVAHPASAADAAGVRAARRGVLQPIPAFSGSYRASGAAARASHPAVSRGSRSHGPSL